ncbi:hypothetical protein ACOMHN_026265 [Nucella lapillus]
MCRQCECGAFCFKDESKGFCCSNGLISLDAFPPPPPFLDQLLDGTDNASMNFKKNIRYYNNAFQMTSFGYHEAAVPGWNPTIRVQGQVYHLIGTLLPHNINTPSFLQVYFIDSREEEVAIRQNKKLHRGILRQLTEIMHANNSYVQNLKSAKDELLAEKNMKVIIREDKRPQGEHSRRFNKQQSSEIAILMDNEPTATRDIVLRLKDGGLKRISELHRSYDPLQYPLIFMYGTDGYNIYMTNASGKKITQQQYYSYHLQVRQENDVHKYCRLFQQLIVDWYCKTETERLMFIRREQKTLRADSYQSLHDTLCENDGDPNNIGQRIVLPSTFVGGPRYMHEKQNDAMAYIRKFGCADLFITMTCNPKWTDITENLLPGQAANDRPDIVSRVFKLKLRKLMDMIKKGIFGTPRAWLYSIEFQKRGLPHAHILVWLLPSEKIRPNDINLAVCAEIPDPEENPDLHKLVMSHMIHGPCGAINQKNCCMDQTTKKCTKKCPKAFHATTDQGEDSYPKYRRRSEEDGGHVGKLKNSVIITNQWVVPYNPYLLHQFNCHINVEICRSIKSIKYVLKYVHKGTDQAVFQLQKAGTAQQEDHQQNNMDEISMFQNARYIGSIEAGWRLLGNDIHERFPMVQRLSVHLENGQRVYFRQDNAMDRAHGPPPATTLTAFFQLCNEDPSAIKLKYPEVPEQYTWQLTRKQWQKRKRGKAIGRMYTISPRQGECYFLRLLLNVVKGPKSYDHLKTVNGEVCATFREARQKQGLLEDDQHLQLAMEEACATQSPKLLRDLLAIILVSCNPSQPGHLWVNFRDHLAEDFLISFRREVGDEAAQYTDTIYNQAVCAIEDQLLALAVNMFNKLLMSEFPGDATAFTSIDTATSDEEAVLYPQELLNSIEMSGLPPHELILKVGAPIILLRALQPPKINNGTRCVVKRLQSNMIEATIACGPFQGEAVLLPRIPLEPTDSPLPFTFRRLQFPIKPAFALTINKSQGQTFSVLGADLREPCFSHGMFYVAVSRTGSCQTLTLLAPKQETRSVVYPEALN